MGRRRDVPPAEKLRSCRSARGHKKHRPTMTNDGALAEPPAQLLDVADRLRRLPLVATQRRSITYSSPRVPFEDVSTVRRRRRLALEQQAWCYATRRRRTSPLTRTL
mmetsp:Transcript_9081/g.37358  ORF Transcript_9081/g.37358 Transcript_9081/m.37358 type:complete len:107 (+) Transcript_9081:120-440(+)